MRIGDIAILRPDCDFRLKPRLSAREPEQIIVLFGAPLNGLYLTPISGSQNKLGDILKGEYKDWAGLILRNIDPKKFPLTWATLLGLENECVFFSDHDRAKTPAPDRG